MKVGCLACHSIVGCGDVCVFSVSPPAVSHRVSQSLARRTGSITVRRTLPVGTVLTAPCSTLSDHDAALRPGTKSPSSQRTKHSAK
jgi:hypothetical protein